MKYLFLILTLCSCTLYTPKTGHEKYSSTAERSAPLKIGIRSDNSLLGKIFRDELMYQLVKKKVNFIFVNASDKIADGTYLDLTYKEIADSEWKPLVLILTLTLVPVKMKSLYEVDTKIFKNGELKDSFTAKSGYESWTQLLLFFPALFEDQYYDTYQSVVSDLTNQILLKL